MQLQYNSHLGGLGPKERRVLECMSKLELLVIQAKDLEQRLGYKRQQANLTLSRLAKKGALQRLKAGMYRALGPGEAVNTPPSDAWAIAMIAFSPCYISGWSAAEHWGLTEQIFNSTLVYTAQKQRCSKTTIAGLAYQTKSITEDKIFGTQTIWSSNIPVLIADCHRTIIDILADPKQGGGGRHMLAIVKAYLQSDDANINQLWNYAERLNNGAVLKRLGWLCEQLLPHPCKQAEAALAKIHTGIIKLDPAGPNTGPIISKWGIQINLPQEDLT